MLVNQSVAVAAHCINPNCPHPYPQSAGHNFCNSCGSPLHFKNRYIPLQRLGIGGFAAIYSVWDTSTETEQVLKVLLESSPKALDLFEQEARVLASLRHPGVPRVESDGYFQVIVGSSPQRLLPCLVMEKISGQTLEDILYLHRQGCPEAWVLNWLKQAVDILRVLHSRQIIHRDIKPSNLMLRYPEPGKKGKRQLVLIDFGGAKQISVGSNSVGSSTRLFSPGYSPPEQMAGSVVTTGADFYALGMTCIHLLTGVQPLDLEDPVTGELKWRDRILINPAFGDLIDAMVQPNVQQRPTNASKIRARILRIYRQKITPGFVILVCGKFIFKIVQKSLNLVWATIKLIWRIIYSILWFIFQTIRTGVSTVLSMIVGGMGAFAGAAAGIWLISLSPASLPLNQFLTQQLPPLIPHIPIAFKPEIILFALAGCTTAWSLSRVGILGRCRNNWAGRVGIFGYVLGWLLWQGASPDRAGLVAMCAIAVYFLTLGLGLPSHQPIYALIAAAGVSVCFSTLVTFNLVPDITLHSLAEAFSRLGWTEPGISLAFFTLIGILLGFWLAVSHYIIIPFLRLLGWR